MNLRDALTSIYHQRGELTPALVVDTARPSEHPLHSHFEWDDAVAGEAYRRDQAHRMIASVRIVTGDESDAHDVRAFVALPGRTAQPCYTPIDIAMSDDMSRTIVLRDFERQLATLTKRFGHLREYADLMRKAIDAA